MFKIKTKRKGTTLKAIERFVETTKKNHKNATIKIGTLSKKNSISEQGGGVGNKGSKICPLYKLSSSRWEVFFAVV